MILNEVFFTVPWPCVVRALYLQKQPWQCIDLLKTRPRRVGETEAAPSGLNEMPAAQTLDFNNERQNAC